MNMLPIVDAENAVPTFADSLPVIQIHGTVAHLLFAVTQSPVHAGGEQGLFVQTRMIVPIDALDAIGLKIIAVARSNLDVAPRATTGQTSSLTN